MFAPDPISPEAEHLPHHELVHSTLNLFECACALGVIPIPSVLNQFMQTSMTISPAPLY